MAATLSAPIYFDATPAGSVAGETQALRLTDTFQSDRGFGWSAAPTATFEVATLSAPVAYAGVTVTFADGVTSTTLVPYRGEAGGQRR